MKIRQQTNNIPLAINAAIGLEQHIASTKSAADFQTLASTDNVKHVFESFMKAANGFRQNDLFARYIQYGEKHITAQKDQAAIPSTQKQNNHITHTNQF